MTWDRRDRSHRVFVAAVVVLVGAHLLSDGLLRDLVSAVAAVLPIIALAALLARRRQPDPRPWHLLLAGLLILLGYCVDWMIRVHALGTGPVGPVNSLALPIGYLVFLAGAGMLVYRPPRHTQGAVVDSAIVAISGSLLIWTLLLGPYLGRLDPPTATRLRTMATVVILGTIAGVLANVATTARARNTSLRYLSLTVVATVVGTVARELTTSGARPLGASWVDLFWIVGFCAVTAAALHPSAAALVPRPDRSVTRITPVTLVALGGALSIGPAIAIAQHLAGQPVDGLLVGGGSLAIVPLVLMRIGQLARMHAAAESRLAHLAGHDELTGLANRRALDAYVTTALTRLDRGETSGLVVIFCDLDGFKEINDRHGHHVGDEVLVVVARRLRSALRADDLVARFGGDEFVVVVEGDPAVRRPETVARIEGALATPVRLGAVLAPAGASIGAASAVPGDSMSGAQLLSAADANMYEQKRVRRVDRIDAPQDVDVRR